MDLIERFRYLMKINQLSPSSFADEIGVQRSSVSHVLSGRNKPSMEFIQKILERFPKVDAAWLISGAKDGKMPQDLPEKIGKPTFEEQSAPEEPQRNPISQTAEKKISKIVIFYEDSTFEEFHQR